MNEVGSRFTLSQILSQLMSDRGLKARDLVKATGLPQTTISNILLGNSKNPRPANLTALANFFDVTVSQLLGYEELELSSAPRIIPVINWDEIKLWISGNRDAKSANIWVMNDSVCKSSKAFALKANPSIKSNFFPPTANATLLIDPQATLEDGSILLIFFKDSQEPFLRLLTIEGDEKWIKPLENDRPSIKLDSNHFVVGNVSEIRIKPGIS